MKPTILSATLAALLLAAPSHAAEPIWDGNKVRMVSEKLADGV